MYDVIIASAISAIAPMTVTFLTWRQSKAKIEEVHKVVNSRLDDALHSIEMLKGEVRRLNDAHSPATTPMAVPVVPAAVTIGADGSVIVAKKMSPFPGIAVPVLPNTQK